ncbi:MAG TPA: acetylornithine transaminase [Actinocrinis sp.]|nr:acetylornithine transaminase [Actinocrinis sp.]
MNTEVNELVSSANAEALPVLRTESGLSAAWTERYVGALMNTFGPPKRVFVRGEGAVVWDADGRRYLDLFAGIAVNALGHAHPLIVQAVTAQLTTLGHVSNFFATAPQVALAERLAGLVRAGHAETAAGRTGPEPDVKVFFCNSGAEANEAAFKLSRLTGRTKVVSTLNSFHGRTMGSLALTGKPAIQEPFLPLPGEVVFVPYGDIPALAAAIDGDTAAFFVEPVQGEGGVRPAPAGYLEAARELTARHGALLVVDEVQTGVGRTGPWFAYQSAGITPDVISLAKGLGGGLPIGASVAIGPAAALLGPGSHGTTFGGNPIACAAGLAVLHAIERDDLLANVEKVGAALREGILALNHPLVANVRGAGLLLGVELTAEVAGPAADAALDAGFIINAVRPDTLRLAPPLILTEAQALEFCRALPAVLDLVAPEGRS